MTVYGYYVGPGMQWTPVRRALPIPVDIAVGSWLATPARAVYKGARFLPLDWGNPLDGAAGGDVRAVVSHERGGGGGSRMRPVPSECPQVCDVGAPLANLGQCSGGTCATRPVLPVARPRVSVTARGSVRTRGPCSAFVRRM